MNVFEGQHFSLLYIKMLSRLLNNARYFAQSRVGSYVDLGPSVLSLLPSGNRWCLVAGRAINPFFALNELSWLLSGSNCLSQLQYFIQNYDKFSDDGETLWGAYGHRLRIHFGYDQIERSIDILANDPTSRRVCMAIWSPEDLGKISADIPCNVLVSLKIRDGALDISVTNRSNDCFLGIVYNVLQFNCLQEFIAQRLGINAGNQIHFIDSLHLYEKDLPEVRRIVSTSDESLIKRTMESVERTSMREFSALDHSRLVHEYDTLIGGADQFSSVKDSFVLWKRGHRTKALQLLPKTELGLAALFWFIRRKDFDKTTLPAWAVHNPGLNSILL